MNRHLAKIRHDVRSFVWEGRAENRTLLGQYAGMPHASLYPLTLNLLAGGNFDAPRVRAFVAAIRPRSLLVMNNSDFALEMQRDFPAMRVLYRRWPDDNSATKYDPIARYWQLAGDVPDKRIGLVFDNEPAYNQATAEYHMAGMELATQEGRWLGALGAGMGGPEKYEWETLMANAHAMYAGKQISGDDVELKALIQERLEEQQTYLAPMLRKMDYLNKLHQQQGRMPHVILLHEYFDFHDPWKSGWNPLEGDTWLIGRFHFLYNACLEMGLEMPPIAITEHGSDSLVDRYHGWLAGEGIGEVQYARYLTDMNELVYSPFCDLGQFIFCWAADHEWKTFNIKNATTLQNLLIEDARLWHEQHQEEPPVNTYVLKRVTCTTDGLAFRAGPGLTYEVLARLVKDKPFNALVGETRVEADDYVWVELISQPTGETGWCAEAWLTFSEAIPDPQAEIALLQQKLSEALTTIEAQNEQLVSVRQELDEMRHYKEVFDALIEFIELVEKRRDEAENSA